MNDFKSALDDDVISNLFGSEASDNQFRIVAIIDRYAKSLVDDIRSQNPDIQITAAHYEDDVAMFLEEADVLLVECRLLEGFRDLKLINSAREIRPFIPIIAVSSNLDTEFMVAAYETGVSDYVGAEIAPELLLAKMRQIRKTADAAVHLEQKNSEVLESRQSLRESKEKLKSAISSRINAETQKEFAQELTNIHKKNKEILDNLREAFFIIHKNLSIDETTSASCRELFGRDISRKKLGSVLSLQNDKEEFIALSLEQLFEDIMPREVTLRMLPKQVMTKQGRTLIMRYNPVFDKTGAIEHVIVMAADITESVAQQKAYQKEKDQVQCLFSILQNKEAFIEFLADFKNDVHNLRQTRNRETAKRDLHTIKGNCGVYHFEILQKRIHAIETKIAQKEVSDLIFFAYMNKVADDIEQHMSQFLEKHRKILSIDYQVKKQDIYPISGEELFQFLKLAKSKEEQARSQLVSALENLRLRPLRLLTAPLHNVVARVANKLHKDIQFTMSGEDLRTDTDSLSPLFRSLVHLITNACDHGIESTDQRLENGKSATGHLHLSIESDPSRLLRLTIADDGAGIAVEKLKRVALEKKLLKPEELQRLRREQVLALIFRDGFSTSDTISQTSGRGVGMSAVKAEVDQLDGSIHIHTEEGKGTRFVIEIPGISCMSPQKLAA